MARFTRYRLAGFVAALAALSIIVAPPPLRAACNGSGFAPIIEGNVVWALKDSVSGCPAADSLLNTGHPSRLRIEIWYSDANCNSKVGVPPESIWVTTGSPLGNLKVNDEGARIYADDSTDAAGKARVTIPSFSGNGRITVTAYVAGVAQGSHTCLVRTTDTNADGRSDAADYNCNFCWSDLNWSGGLPGGSDLAILLAHATPKHWHRNALFGTLIRRTNMCPTCPIGTPNTLGGDFTWAPHGKLLCVSVYNAAWDCAIYLLPSDAPVGNGLIPFSHPPFGSHDYDPSWSPLGDQIVWDRRDHDFYTKGVPGHSADTLEHQIPVASSLVTQTDMSLSPDGNTIAFSGATSGSPSIYTVPVIGGAPRRITSDANVADDFPQWSPDGKTIVFFRSTLQGYRVYQVLATDTTGVSLRAVTAADTGLAPSFSSDGNLLLYSRGGARVLATLDSAVTSGAGPVLSYPQFTTFLMVPKLSPDGTRLALRASPPIGPSENPQLWAARRNMSLPPAITSFGGQSIADSTALIPVSILENLAYSASIAASDPEGDQITYSAFFQQLGMVFSPSTRTFSWTPPPGTSGKKFNVKFIASTPAGGIDAVIVQFTVNHAAVPARSLSTVAFRVATTNPVRDRFVLMTPPATGEATLDILDPAGRRIARTQASAGAPLEWKLTSTGGMRVKPGVYFYRAVSGAQRTAGKLVVIR